MKASFPAKRCSLVSGEVILRWAVSSLTTSSHFSPLVRLALARLFVYPFALAQGDSQLQPPKTLPFVLASLALRECKAKIGRGVPSVRQRQTGLGSLRPGNKLSWFN